MKPKTADAAPAAAATVESAQIEAGAAAAKTFADKASASTSSADAVSPANTASTFTPMVASVTAGIQQTQERVITQMDKVVRTAEDLVSFGQGNLEAVMRSSQIWLAGVQDLTKQVATSAQEQVDATVSALRALTTVRSPKEAMELQSNLARTSFEKAVNETRRLSDSSYKLAEQAAAPLAARMTLALEKFARVPA